MHLKQAIGEVSGLKFIVDSLNILSSAGRRYLMALPFRSKKEELESIYSQNQQFSDIWDKEENKNTFSLLEMKLSQLRDIHTTIKLLETGHVLDDIGLFEVKHFAILAESINDFLKQLGISFFNIPDVDEPISILDPEGKKIPHFHVYDVYSSELAEKRRQMKNASENEKEQIRLDAESLEDECRRKLSEKLQPFAQNLYSALSEIARLDVELAKTEIANRFGLSKPDISAETTTLRKIFNPQLEDFLYKQGKVFQRIDISIPQKPTLITGANMAGKSVLLKTVALIQYMAQFGFFVPAASAHIVLVDKVIFSIGDGQDEMNGLSSFSSEMLRLNEMVESLKKGKKLLVLIDELARTTNPIEGKAIVCGMVDYLSEHNVSSLITTHYAIDIPCRKLRVKGFTEKGSEKITSKNINNYIDYSLEETADNAVPQEAIKIAEIIGVDKDILERGKKYLS